MTIIEHYWAANCLECETRKLFADYGTMERALDQHRRTTGHHVSSGTHAHRTGRPHAVIHSEAIANVINILGIASIVSDVVS